MHRYDDVENADHAKAADRATERDLDRPTQLALAQGDPAPLGAPRLSALQRAAGNAGVAGLVDEDAGDSVRSVLSSGAGRPLDDDTRSEMESGLGADFSSVRVHTGGQASRSAEAVAASAYTVGDDIVFRDGRYDPSSDAGRRTLAHELTHVVQQRQGPVDGTPAAGGIKVSDPNDPFERQAEASADAVMSRQVAAAGERPSATVSRESTPEEELQAQRQGEEEEEELQAQRQGEEEEEELQAQRQGEEEGEEEELAS